MKLLKINMVSNSDKLNIATIKNISIFKIKIIKKYFGAK